LVIFMSQHTFLYGVATSSYQIEGAVREDGRGPSIWDTFCRVPGNILDGSSGEIACDHYHRYPEDIQLMKELGVQAYRFSIAWPRILPEGRGEINPQGLDFYERLTDALLAQGILPFATLYHWDLPQALPEGWLARDTALAFADYASIVARRLGDRIPFFATLNEPWVSAFVGHLHGEHAPGLRDLPAALKAAHHLLLAHGLALQALRSETRAQLGIVLNLTSAYPNASRPEDHTAAERVDRYLNGWFLDPLLKGRYPELFDELPPVQERDFELIQAPLDFLGVNYYQRALVTAGPGFLGARFWPGRDEVTQMNWEVSPGGLLDLLLRLQHETGGKLPIYITENGAAYYDELDQDQVQDPGRIRYLARHLAALEEARARGVPVRGYFVWSFLDNFEWAYGYTRRFGLVYVDYPTQRRIPKSSFFWYQSYIAQHREDRPSQTIHEDPV
jgi:beta-glucosidase